MLSCSDIVITVSLDGTNGNHPQRQAQVIRSTYPEILDWVDRVEDGTLLPGFHLVR